MLTLQNNIRFALYARLSREDEIERDESRSIENQKKNLKQYLESKNFILVNEYIDDGVSGASLDRPGFNSFLADFEAGKVDALIVKDLSRLGRNLVEVGRFVEEYAVENNLRIISVLDNYDSAINHDDDSIVFKSFVNDYYLKECKKKLRAAIAKKAAEGPLLLFGSYGYNVIDKKLVINEFEANVVRFIFDEYLKGKMPKELITCLNKNNIPGPGQALFNKCGYVTKDNCDLSWKQRNIFDIIHNTSYSGYHVNCKKKSCVVESNIVKIPPIIDKETQDKAITLAKSRNNVRDEYLSHFIYNTVEKKYFKCKRPYDYYHKQTGKVVHWAGYINSKGMSFKPDEIKEIILKETKRVIKELRKNETYILEYLNGTLANNKQDLAKINEELLDISTKRKMLTDDYIIGSINKDDYNTKKNNLLNRQNELEKAKNEIEIKTSSLKNNNKYKRYVKEILSYKHVDLALSRVIFKRIDVSFDTEKNKVLTFIYNI